MTLAGLTLPISRPFRGSISSNDSIWFDVGLPPALFDVGGGNFVSVTLLARELYTAQGGDRNGPFNLDAQFVLVPGTTSDVDGNSALVPEPTSILFLGTGLTGLAGAARRRLRK